tara:strand:+ start:1270 stop:1893 length:624 start_codon:yes stop_codon:yes gene_type:complete
MPKISVKSAAELLRVPAYSQVRILTEQKYPKSGQQVFRTPYYATALSGIRAYFKSGKSKSSLFEAKSKIQSLSQESRRENNFRVLKAFEKSAFSKMPFQLAKSPKIYASLGSVELKLSPDLRLVDNKQSIVVYVNCRTHPIDEEIARYTLEIAHWVLEQNRQQLPLRNFIYLDLAKNIEISFKKRRAKTMDALQQNAKVIDALWPTL